MKRGPYAMRLPSGNVKFKRGVKLITGHRTEKRALPGFRLILRRILESGHGNPAKIEELFVEVYGHFRENGFSDIHLSHLRDAYRKLPRRAPRKKISEKTVCEAKSELDASGEAPSPT